MYVRIAQFQGNGDDTEQRINDVREEMRSGMRVEGGPPIKRALMLIDRANDRGAGVIFCETEDDLRRVDEFMNNMTMPAGGGTRTGVEMYEVAVDSDEL